MATSEDEFDAAFRRADTAPRAAAGDDIDAAFSRIEGVAPIGVSTGTPKPTNIPNAGPMGAPTPMGGNPLVAKSDPRMSSLMESAINAPPFNPSGMAFLSGVHRTFTNARQFGVDALETLNILPPGTADRMKALTDAEADELNDQLTREIGSEVKFRILNQAGQLAPTFVIPGGPEGAGLLTGLARVLYSASAGAVTGAIASNEGETLDARMVTRGKDATVGAGVGLGFGAAFEVGTQATQRFAKFIKGGMDSKFAKEGMELDRKFRELTGGKVGLKLSQVTGDPAAEGMEAAARSKTSVERIARDFEQNQTQELWGQFKRTLTDIIDSPEPFGERVQKAFDSTLESLSVNRRAQAAKDFQAAFDAAEAATKGSMEKSLNRIPVTNFVAQIDSLLAGIPERAPAGSEKLRGALIELRRKFESGNGLVSVKELHAQLAAWGDEASGTGAAFKDILDNAGSRRVGSKLFAGLQDDLNAAAESGIPGAELLKVARDNYRRNTEPMNALRETALGRFLGDTSAIKTPDELEARIGSMAPDQLMNGMRLLQKADPQIHQSLQRFWLERSMERVGTLRQETEFANLNLRKMLDILNKEGHFNAIYTDPVVRDRILTNLQLVGRVSRNVHQQGRGRIGQFMKESAGIIASRSPTFAARWAAEMFTPAAMAKYMDSAEATKALETLAKPYNAAKWSAAVATLANISYPEQPQE